jgi:hypothetical protein
MPSRTWDWANDAAHALALMPSPRRFPPPWSSEDKGTCLIVRERKRLRISYLVPAHESLHLLEGNGAIVVGIHCLEDALLGRLPFL